MNTVKFDYQLTRASTFESLLSGDGNAIDEIGAISAIKENGRSILQARGGAGKSTYLRHLREIADGLGVRSVLLSAGDWSAAIREHAGRLADATELERCIRRMSAGSIGDLLVLLDGVNEVPGDVAKRLLSAVDVVAGRFPRYSFVATDRLIRREFGSTYWALFGLTEVSKTFVEDAVGSSLSDTMLHSLQNPFYLNLAMSENPGSRSELHFSYLTAHASLKPEELPEVAAFAYDQYQRNGSRRIDEVVAAEMLGKDLVQRLQGAGVLVLEGLAHFSHHLIADYLAALHVARQGKKLSYGELNALTFKASSFDGLALLLEMSNRDPDELIRDVYDWNMYGAGYLLGEDQAGDQKISHSMTLVILGMLGDRRFDIFTSTSRQVEDALRVISSLHADAILSAKSREDVAQIVEKASGGDRPSWFQKWLSRFTTTPRAASEVSLRLEVEDGDAIIGWTASNAIRRSATGPEDVTWASGLLAHDNSDQVRWRAAHFLGATKSSDAVEALLGSLDNDVQEWVKYGALRSLIEIAATSERALSRNVLTEISHRSSLVLSHPRLARELERTLPVGVGANDMWIEDTEPLITALWSASVSVDEQDRWTSLGREIRNRKS